jgi:hypothetical protein
MSNDCPFFPLVEDTNDCPFTDDIRYLNKENNKNLLELESRYFLEQIAQYGTETDYIFSNYSLSAQDFFYGEHTTKTFSDPVPITMFVLMNQDSIILGQFGIASDADITAFVHISAFKDSFGLSAEPNAGDLIRLTEYGKGRPNGRGEAIFEVTRRDDEDLTQINPRLGHFLWLIRGKRYDYSHENNVDPEDRSNQVNDDSPATSLSSEALSSDYVKPYDGEVDEFGKDNIFDYDENIGSDDSVYGDY